MAKARIENLEVLKAFKAALWKFQSAAMVALEDAESDIRRTISWLEGEAPSYWSSQIRKRQEIVGRCREAVRQKKLFKDSTGRTPSAVEEEKALAVALKRLQEAEEKMAAAKRWSRKLQKELEAYRGGVAPFSTAVHSDIPVASAQIEKAMVAIDAYMALTARAPTDETPEAASGGMAMAPDEVPMPSEPPQESAGNPEQPPVEPSEPKQP